MAVASMATPIKPPSASISRTRWPFAVPPIAGLHGMDATVSRESVHTPTRHPMRAAANAASTPACPAPTTMTSYRITSLDLRSSFSDAELFEDVLQDFVARTRPDDLAKAGPRGVQVGQHEFL